MSININLLLCCNKSVNFKQHLHNNDMHGGNVLKH